MDRQEKSGPFPLHERGKTARFFHLDDASIHVSVADERFKTHHTDAVFPSAVGAKQREAVKHGVFRHADIGILLANRTWDFPEFFHLLDHMRSSPFTDFFPGDSFPRQNKSILASSILGGLPPTRNTAI